MKRSERGLLLEIPLVIMAAGVAAAALAPHPVAYLVLLWPLAGLATWGLAVDGRWAGVPVSLGTYLLISTATVPLLLRFRITFVMLAIILVQSWLSILAAFWAETRARR